MDGYVRDGLGFDVTDTGGGARPVALCLHGFPQDRSTWAAVAGLLSAAGVRVLAPDQRGYSPRSRPPRSAGRRAFALPELVADAVALLDAAGVDRAHVVGHDWGGVVAWALAASHPARVASLTALSQPHPAATGRAARTVVGSSQALRSWYVGAFQVPVVPELLLSRSGGRPLERALVRGGLPPELARGYAARAVDGPVGSSRLAAGIGWYRALPHAGPVGPVSAPVTYLHGWQDPFYAPAAVLGAAAHATGRFERRTLDTGHWVPELEPEAVAAAVLEQVERAEPT